MSGQSVSGLRATVAMRSAGQVLAVRLLDRDMWACQHDKVPSTRSNTSTSSTSSLSLYLCVYHLLGVTLALAVVLVAVVLVVCLCVCMSVCLSVCLSVETLLLKVGARVLTWIVFVRESC